jgi:hypothetical protein
MDNDLMKQEVRLHLETACLEVVAYSISIRMLVASCSCSGLFD